MTEQSLSPSLVERLKSGKRVREWIYVHEDDLAEAAAALTAQQQRIGEVERERDEARGLAHGRWCAFKDAQSECSAWKARAQAAEARLAKARKVIDRGAHLLRASERFATWPAAQKHVADACAFLAEGPKQEPAAPAPATSGEQILQTELQTAPQGKEAK